MMEERGNVNSKHKLGDMMQHLSLSEEVWFIGYTCTREQHDHNQDYRVLQARYTDPSLFEPKPRPLSNIALFSRWQANLRCLVSHGVQMQW